jgi:hypothetical protein
MSLIGSVNGLTPFVCCKRALIGAVLAYVAGHWAVRAINYILVNAMVTNQIEKQNIADVAASDSIALGETDSDAAD